MTATNLQFHETNLFSKLILDYMKQDPAVQEFYKYPPTMEAIDHVIQDKIQLMPLNPEEGIDRHILVDTIKKQYAGLEITEKVSENIQSLENSITFCIVTAHQLNVFTGPLYYIYKIAQSISTCDQLTQKYQNYNFVPVYWMGSEDHDFEEINHVSLFNKKIEWTDKQRGATGEYTTASILPLIDELKNIIGDGPYVNVLLDIFRTAYALPTVTEASRYLVNALFGKYGLVVVDGNDKAFKQQFAEVIKDELQNRNSIQLVTEQIQKLEAKGYKEQAFPRDINLFYLTKNSRERIEYHPGTNTFRIHNTETRFTPEEIVKEVDEHPERFSPNVILRPLFQQKTLPSLAYIGGAGEVSYWLQLKPVFDFYKVNYPQLLVRNSTLLVSENISRKIEKLGFKVQDFFKETDQLIKTFIAENSDADLDVSGYKKNIETEFSKLQELAKNVDASLVNAIGAEMQKSLQSIDTIQKRIVKSLKQKNETELNQLEKIKNQLFPENSLQERVENFSSWYARLGQSFIDELVSAFDVYQKQFLIINDI